MKKRGRKRLESGAKSIRYEIRISDEEYRRLSELSDFYNKSKSEIIRDGLNNLYLLMIYRN